ncbi:hypothetical protein SEA_WATERMOORE_137 [Streptomyces phage Watermoore]|nr:hypothetical protein SEA_CROSS_138 [Streptomyces phage Cross]WNN95484.1 hypothetical protein SEA_WATERMOORE_137 [Streptomyces phage Watermoore]
MAACPKGGKHEWKMWSGKYRCRKCGETSKVQPT